MKVAFLFSPYTCPRPLNFNNIWNDSRGLSGSDLGIIRTCQEFVKMGHDVSLFTVFAKNNPDTFDGIKLFKYEQKDTSIDETYDCLVSWSCPDDFRGLPTNALRVCCDMLNGFSYCKSGFDNFVDIWTFCSEPHKAFNLSFNLIDEKKVHVLPLGCDPELYTSNKVPGRMIWASSAERGLFWLLSVWPDVKKSVPDAHLKIFYNFDYGSTSEFERGICESQTAQSDVYEFAQRIRYMQYAIPKLKHLGVQQIGSVSREVINREMSEAMVLAYPCDPIAWSEGFSCSLLEACAAKACPISTKVDALDHIYGQTFPTIDLPVSKSLDKLTELIIKALTNNSYRNEINRKCENLANQHTWKITAQKLDRMIDAGLTSKKETPIIVDCEKITKLNIACGTNVFPHDGWINYDQEDIVGYLDNVRRLNTFDMPDHQKNIVNYLMNGGNIKFHRYDLMQGFPQHHDNSVDLIYVGQAIEHLNVIYQTPLFLKECYRMLKPAGIIRITTPDLDKIMKAYLNNDMGKFSNEQPSYYKDFDESGKLSLLMFGATGPACTSLHYEGHFFIYTQNSMIKILQDAGFSDIHFYDETGKSASRIMSSEVVDFGVSHSMIVEAIK